MIRAGIIGWGENGRDIAEALHFKIKGTEVVGIATEDPEGRDYATRKMGLKHVFSSYASLLELHQIDIICICSEGDMHLTHVEKSLTSGSNIFIDHPLASNVEDCQRLEKVIDSYPSYKCTAAFPRRFDNRLQELKKEVATGKLGHIISIDCNTYEAVPMRSDNNGIPKVTKGIFMDLMLQDIDLVKWLTGSEYMSVYSIGNAKKYPSLSRQNDADTAHAIARMSSDILVNFTSSRVTHRGSGYEIKITGTLGEVSISSTGADRIVVDNQDQKPYYMTPSCRDNHYLPLLQNYVDSIRFGNKIDYMLSDATDATRVAVAMTKSFLLGEEVRLN